MTEVTEVGSSMESQANNRSSQQTSPVRDQIQTILEDYVHEHFNDQGANFTKLRNEATEALLNLMGDVSKVDRLEVIDETGRAYVKGSIYGSPVKVELSYQDAGKTLKVFVEETSI